MNRFITACFRFMLIPLTLGILPFAMVVGWGWKEFVEWITAGDLY